MAMKWEKKDETIFMADENGMFATEISLHIPVPF